MLSALPGWAIDDDASVREEVLEWAGTTAEERWRLAELCSRDVVWAVNASAHPERVLEHVDPLPATSIAALARLRREARWGDGGA